MKSIATLCGVALLGSINTGFAATEPRADASPFPGRPVRLIIPFTAGGGNDIVARAVAQKLGELWGQQVIADNRVGANGIIGTDMVAKANPDGHTLVVVSTSFTMNPSMTKIPFDPVKDFAPIGLVAEGALILTAYPKFPAHNMAELIALARAKPGEISFSSSGHGGVTHLAGELLQRMAKISLLHVPYKGSSAGVLDVIGGQVPLMVSSISPAITHLQAGQLRAIGIGSRKRSALLPEVATIAEQGVAGYDSSMWWGLMAPAGTPAPVLDKIADTINRGMLAEDVQKRISTMGMSVLTSTRGEFREIVSKDIVKWGQIIKDIGVTQQ
jgi:tripartite-type tricarboxylate transporter receptor subunit TctC